MTWWHDDRKLRTRLTVWYIFRLIYPPLAHSCIMSASCWEKMEEWMRPAAVCEMRNWTRSQSWEVSNIPWDERRIIKYLPARDKCIYNAQEKSKIFYVIIFMLFSKRIIFSYYLEIWEIRQILFWQSLINLKTYYKGTWIKVFERANPALI